MRQRSDKKQNADVKRNYQQRGLKLPQFIYGMPTTLICVKHIERDFPLKKY